MDKYSYLSNAHPEVIDSMYLQYKQNPESVAVSWRQFFEGFDFARTDYNVVEGAIPQNVSKEFKVIQLINGYRQRGHLFTKTNPVRERRQYKPSLGIENFGLTVADMDVIFQAGNEIGIGASKLRDIIAHLETTYCQSIGAEFMFVRDPQVIKWLETRMEGTKNTPNFSLEEKKEILKKINQAVVFENFLATKFVGQKRFSLEGGEALIPAMDYIIETGAELGVQDFVIGMAHRGRLSVLTNIMNKPYKDVFTEFEGRTAEDVDFDGDVKYHQGFSSDQLSASGKHVHISLTPNPSHLETVDPVVEGISRAKIDHKHNGNNSQVCPILLHGDAALAGQGIVYEVIQMSQLDGYKTGGTIHVVTNNQVGFTTNYTDGRSSTYCTDVAKVTLSPVFHVNGDDAEAVVLVAKLAIEFRQIFKRDVFIDILCYRKYGHNEGDEPRFTQPILYKAIAAHPNPLVIYVNQLVNEGSITAEEAKQVEKDFKNQLEADLAEAKLTEKAKITSYLEGTWNGLKQADSHSFDKSPDTGIDKKTFLALAEKITSLPKDKKFFSKIVKIFEERAAMIKNNNYDWAMGELMAYTSLMNEGHYVRLSGQDVERGTFSHRHAVIKIEDSEEEYIPINNAGTKAKFDVYNSFLSEYAVLGFEYGYAFASPDELVIWEAQFGDFFNGAQIIIDQFLSAAEYKWKRLNGMVLFLPHGYEGQGPEHSSGRMERFLQMCADDNMQVINATTPANHFHALRRQLKRDFRKPLICFTPKKLLRYPTCVSTLEDFTTGGFKEVIDDKTAKVTEIKTLILCCGKIYYDLIERREKERVNEIAIVRVEQLYPYPKTQIEGILAKYKNAKKIIWAQEESENMGAWRFMFKYLYKTGIEYVGREESASPATGYMKLHNNQTETILNKIFSKKLEPSKN